MDAQPAAQAPLTDLPVAEMGCRLRAGQVSSEALARAALARIAAANGALHAFITVTAERALADARRVDAELAAGHDRGPMHGVPYALKDIYDTAGIRTTCHSKLREDVVPGEDSAVAARLCEAGGVLLGKLATHEFAIGGPSFDLPFPPARNPWNREHFTGGSSSGSGAAVASGMVRIALGSDTGGSIRGPAAFCGIVGIKPTYGRVSRRGVFPLSYTLDHCGPLRAASRTPRSAFRPSPATTRSIPAAPTCPCPISAWGCRRASLGCESGCRATSSRRRKMPRRRRSRPWTGLRPCCARPARSWRTFPSPTTRYSTPAAA